VWVIRLACVVACVDARLVRVGHRRFACEHGSRGSFFVFLNWVDTVVSLFNSYFPLFYLMILIILWEAVSVQALVSAAAAQPLSGGSYCCGTTTGLNFV
jgi:hypothetical protein